MLVKKPLLVDDTCMHHRDVGVKVGNLFMLKDKKAVKSCNSAAMLFVK